MVLAAMGKRPVKRAEWEWQIVGGTLHATLIRGRYRNCPGDEVTAVCGDWFVLVREDFPRKPTRTPSCDACNAVLLRLTSAAGRGSS